MQENALCFLFLPTTFGKKNASRCGLHFLLWFTVFRLVALTEFTLNGVETLADGLVGFNKVFHGLASV